MELSGQYSRVSLETPNCLAREFLAKKSSKKAAKVV